MELSREFDKVDAMPIGEDVRHLDKQNENVINMIMAVYLRDSLYDHAPSCQYTVNCRRDNGELIRIMFNGRDWFFGRTPESGIPQHSTKVTRDDLGICMVSNVFLPVNVSERVSKMTIGELLQDICSWYVARAKNTNKDVIPPYKFVDAFNRSKFAPLANYDVLIHTHSTWIKYCQEKMYDSKTSEYDYRRLILEKSEYQTRIDALLTVKYAMIFAEQENK